MLLRLALLLAAVSRSAAQRSSASVSAGHSLVRFVDGDALVFAPNGTLYVADASALRVLGPDSASARTLLTGGAFTAVCVDAARGAVYAVDSGASPAQLLQVYSAGSARLVATGVSGRACAVDASGNIVVANMHPCVRVRAGGAPRAAR